MFNFEMPWKKNRPSSLEQTALFDGPMSEPELKLENDPQVVQTQFDRLVRVVCRDLCSQPNSGPHFQAPPVRREHGRLTEGRLYCYLQAWNEVGWLIEMASCGWLISRADKIVHEQLFLRSRETWDVVNLLRSPHPGGLVRVSSSRIGGEPLCYPIYEDWLRKELGAAILGYQYEP